VAVATDDVQYDRLPVVMGIAAMNSVKPCIERSGTWVVSPATICMIATRCG
jgi:hypothetical protein